MSKTYKPEEVICVVNGEKIEGFSSEAVEWSVKKKDCSHFWYHSHCGKYKKCIKCDEIVEIETHGGVFDIDYLAKLTKEPSHKMPSGMSREQRREWARSILSKDDESGEN